MKPLESLFLVIGSFLFYACSAFPGFANEASILGDELRSKDNDAYYTTPNPFELKKSKSPDSTDSTCNEQREGFQFTGLGISYVKRNPCEATVSPEAP